MIAIATVSDNSLQRSAYLLLKSRNDLSKRLAVIGISLKGRKGKRGRGAARKVPIVASLKCGGKVHVVIIPNTEQIR